MSIKRRDFIEKAGMAAAGLIITPEVVFGRSAVA